MAKRILLPVDGSPQSRNALSFAVEEWPDAEITLLHIVNPAEAAGPMETTTMTSEWRDRADERANALLDEMVESIAHPVETRVEVGHPPGTIVKVAADGYDHIVVGSHGRKGLSRIFLGSVAEEVIRNAPVPVTVVR